MNSSRNRESFQKFPKWSNGSRRTAKLEVKRRTCKVCSGDGDDEKRCGLLRRLRGRARWRHCHYSPVVNDFRVLRGAIHCRRCAHHGPLCERRARGWPLLARRPMAAAGSPPIYVVHGALFITTPVMNRFTVRLLSLAEKSPRVAVATLTGYQWLDPSIDCLSYRLV